MGDPPERDTDSWPAKPGESSWERLARLRQRRAELDRVIPADTPAAVAEAKRAGVKVAELADLWGVTAAWIYTVAPARPKRSRQ